MTKQEKVLRETRQSRVFSLLYECSAVSQVMLFYLFKKIVFKILTIKSTVFNQFIGPLFDLSREL